MDIKQHFANLFQSGEYARLNQFSCEIFSPIDNRFSTSELSRIRTNLAGASIPGLSIETKEHSQGGFVQKKLPHTKQYQELHLRFYLSADHLEKRFFQAWMDMIFDPIYQNLEYYDQYAIGSIIIHQHVRTSDEPIVSYKYIECYPISYPNIDLSNASENSIGEINLTMAYHSWTDVTNE